MSSEQLFACGGYSISHPCACTVRVDTNTLKTKLGMHPNTWRHPNTCTHLFSLVSVLFVCILCSAQFFAVHVQSLMACHIVLRGLLLKLYSIIQTDRLQTEEHIIYGMMIRTCALIRLYYSKDVDGTRTFALEGFLKAEMELL